VKLFTRVEGDSFVARWCRLVPNGRRFELVKVITIHDDAAEQ